jgi:hypothetical protein
MAVFMRNAAIDVREAIVPGAGHWLMEENTSYTVALVRDFLAGNQHAGESRVAPGEYPFPAGSRSGGRGTSEVAGIQTIVLKGDPNSDGFTLSCCAFRQTHGSQPTSTRTTGSRQ